MQNRKYFLDLNDLQYKQIRLPWKKKLFRLFLWFAGTIAITVVYGMIFENIFGSPKEKMLNQQIENLVLQYKLTGMELDKSYEALNGLKMSDEIRYRPILEMDSIPQSVRNPGFGGVERFRNLNGYIHSDIMKSARVRIEEMKNMAVVQSESFVTIGDRSLEWKYEIDHSPAISPVDPVWPIGDVFRFRDKHPVLGIGKMHLGVDFMTPYGTKVYATGDGKVIRAGWNSSGFGNLVVIDHGNGLQSYYGHLSAIKVSEGMNIKRGDNLGLSGSTGLSSGPHLHYQINKLGSAVNAIYYFNDDLTEDQFREMIQAFGSKSMFR